MVSEALSIGSDSQGSISVGDEAVDEFLKIMKISIEKKYGHMKNR